MARFLTGFTYGAREAQVLLAIMIGLLSGGFFYIQAMKNGMPARRWGLLGMLLGPFIYPLFLVNSRLHWRRVLGRRYGILRG